MTPTTSPSNVTEPTRCVVKLRDGMSLWIRWLSTTVPAATVALPFGNDEYVPGLTPSTATADASVKFCRSLNATALVAFSKAFNFADDGAELSRVTDPVELDMVAPATV